MERVLSIVASFFLFCGCSVRAQMSSDREHDELFGSVRVVRSEKTVFAPPNSKSRDQHIEIKQVIYAVDGKKSEEVTNNPDGSLANKSTFEYDNYGKRSVVTVYKADGSVYLKRIFRQTKTATGTTEEESAVGTGATPVAKAVHKYDIKGRATELIAFGPEGKPEMRIVTAYNDQGKPAEINFFQDSETKAAKVVFSYDGSGNVSEVNEYDADGSPGGRRVFSGDTARGSDITMTEYDSKGNLVSKERYIREFDSHGNWTKETKTIMNSQTRQWEPVEITQRRITYY